MTHPEPTRRIVHRPDLAGTPRAPRPTAPEAAPRPEPTIGSMTVSLLSSTARWLMAGRPMTSPAGLAARQGACNVCPHWAPAAWGGRGKCKLCGCTGIKLTWATETCPDKPPRWGPETTQDKALK